jgi:Tol biopolymer transport system component
MRTSSLRPRPLLGVVLVLGLLLASAPAPAAAQAAVSAPAKKAMTVDDYAKWRTISDQTLSPDGKWLVYVLELTNVLPGETKPETHVVNLGTNKETVVNDATGPVFSPDSRWIAYQVDPGAAQRARQARAGTAGSGNAALRRRPRQVKPGNRAGAAAPNPSRPAGSS